ncbi:MAG: YicC/YloC family endoribonuclease [Clostridia bacterium]|nr:YicC/YloC family endoribonuclease [Clostridia bacterium]
MLQSMTGYGRCEKEINGYRINIELKSVNNRFTDFSIKLPRYYNFLEDFVREYLKGYISRGKVDVFIRIEKIDGGESLVTLNRAYAESYIAALRELRDSFSLSDDISVMTVARNADVFSFERAEEDEELLKNSVKEVLDEVMEAYVGMRKREGERLKHDIETKLEGISAKVAAIEKIEPDVVREYCENLEQKITELLGNADFDRSRVLTEVAVFADKAAIDEETVRLKSHIKEFSKTLEASAPVGKKLDFILQEMNREINTTGSKANNIKISKIVIDVKSELEKIREQIQNIE